MSFWQRTSSSSLMSCCVDEVIFFGERKCRRINAPAARAARTAVCSAAFRFGFNVGWFFPVGVTRPGLNSAKGTVPSPDTKDGKAEL